MTDHSNSRLSLLFNQNWVLNETNHTFCFSHGRKRAKKIAAGKLEVSEESLFDSFRVATTIHGRYYSESHTMLGQTYGMCVLQVNIPILHSSQTISYTMQLWLILCVWDCIGWAICPSLSQVLTQFGINGTSLLVKHWHLATSACTGSWP